MVLLKKLIESNSQSLEGIGIVSSPQKIWFRPFQMGYMFRSRNKTLQLHLAEIRNFRKWKIFMVSFKEIKRLRSNLEQGNGTKTA